MYFMSELAFDWDEDKSKVNVQPDTFSPHAMNNYLPQLKKKTLVQLQLNLQMQNL